MHHTNIVIQVPSDKIYLLKHKLLSNVVKFSVSRQSKHEFIKNLSSNKNLLAQFELVSQVQCADALSVFEKVQFTLKAQLTYGELYQVSPKEALKVVRREAYRIDVIHAD